MTAAEWGQAHALSVLGRKECRVLRQLRRTQAAMQLLLPENHLPCIHIITTGKQRGTFELWKSPAIPNRFASCCIFP